MKLYDSRPRAQSAAVRIFLAEKGITVPTEQVDMMTGAHKTPEYTRHQSAAAHAGAGARRRHRHHGVDRDLPLFRGAAARTRRCSASAPRKPRWSRCGMRGARSICCWRSRTCFAICIRRRRHWKCRRCRMGRGQQAAGRSISWKSSTSNWRKTNSSPATRFSVADITALCAVDFMKPAQGRDAGRIHERETLARRGVGAAERNRVTPT